MLTNDAFSRLPVNERKSGLLIPKGAEVDSANEKIAEQYREEAILQASGLMKTLTPDEIASFLYTKNYSAEIIAGQV
jgi:hypothetical protein